MKLNVNRQELDECIANVVSKVLKEYSFDDFDDFSDDDMLDATVDDPDLRAALSGKKAKKAKNAAKAQGDKEIADAEKEEEKAEEDEFVQNSGDYGEDSDEEDFDEEGDEEDMQSDKAEMLRRQLADVETDPLVKQCVDAGVPLKDLYAIRNGNHAVLKKYNPLNLQWMAKHPNFGRKADPMSSLGMQLGTENDFGRTRFKMKGAPISKKKAQLLGKNVDDYDEGDESQYSYNKG